MCLCLTVICCCFFFWKDLLLEYRFWLHWIYWILSENFSLSLYFKLLRVSQKISTKCPYLLFYVCVCACVWDPLLNAVTTVGMEPPYCWNGWLDLCHSVLAWTWSLPIPHPFTATFCNSSFVSWRVKRCRNSPKTISTVRWWCFAY